MTIYLLVAFLLAPGVSFGAENDYKIGPGDLLSITVFGEEDMSLKEIRVGGNGSISFPLLGEIKVDGLTSKELERRLTAALLDGYLKKPEVTVSVLDYRMFYVSGEVSKPGGYKYVDGLTVRKAIALAGGFTPRASENRITLVREAQPDKPVKNVSQNAVVQPGDILIVDESLF